MYSRDYRDIIGGGLVLACGAFAAYHAASNYNMGTPAHMGPGMFPAVIGVLMAVLGLWIMVPALFRAGDALVLNLRSILFLSAALGAFAILATWLGLIVAVVATVVIASFAEPQRNYLHIALLSAALVIMAILVFRIGLAVQIPVFPWSA